MPVQIVANLKATPNPTALPKRIELRQTMVSLLANEDVTIVYSLDPAHNVFFKDGDAAPAKTFTRQDTLSQKAKTCSDRVTLVEKAGGDPMDLVTIEQVITDSVGLTLNDLVIVQIKR